MNLLINRMVYKKVIHYKDLPDHVKKEYCPRDEKVSNKTKVSEILHFCFKFEIFKNISMITQKLEFIYCN